MYTYNNPKLETTQISINSWRDDQIVVYSIQRNTYSAIKKELPIWISLKNGILIQKDSSMRKAKEQTLLIHETGVRRVVAHGCGGVTGRRYEVPGVLIGVVVSCVYMFIKLYQNVCLRFLYCILPKTCFKN